MNQTPKEKADELIAMYRFRLLFILAFQAMLTEQDLLKKCKECALIAVNEVIKSWQEDGNRSLDQNLIHWWRKVKKEIDNSVTA